MVFPSVSKKLNYSYSTLGQSVIIQITYKYVAKKYKIR